MKKCHHRQWEPQGLVLYSCEYWVLWRRLPMTLHRVKFGRSLIENVIYFDWTNSVTSLSCLWKQSRWYGNLFMTSVQTLFAPLDHREHVPPEYRPGTLAQSQGFVGHHRINRRYVMWPAIISHSQTFQLDDVAKGRLGYDHLETFLYKSHGQLLEGTATSRQKNLIKFSKYYSQTKKDRKCFTFSIFLSSSSHLLVRILELHTLD